MFVDLLYQDFTLQILSLSSFWFLSLPGVTGGLAAPLVAAGASAVLGAGGAAALGSATGIAIMASLFGAAGAGLTGKSFGRKIQLCAERIV